MTLTALSPSRVNDFKKCPQLFKFRAIDRLPEPPSVAMARGTLVHLVLERLFDKPAAERTVDTALGLLTPAFEELSRSDRSFRQLLAEQSGAGDEILQTAPAAVRAYFGLEDPTKFTPEHREVRLQADANGDVPALKGIIDRVDVAPDGRVRVVDYKTGKAPSERFEGEALFQMRFYALLWWRQYGVIPARLTLHYMGNGMSLSVDPREGELLATEREIVDIWRQIERANASGDWPPRPSKLCDWCYHKPICPAFSEQAAM